MRQGVEIGKIFIKYLQAPFRAGRCPSGRASAGLMAPRPELPSPPKGTRRRIVDLLRRSPLTANELALKCDMTHNAVRGHLTALQRDGLVARPDGLGLAAFGPPGLRAHASRRP